VGEGGGAGMGRQGPPWAVSVGGRGAGVSWGKEKRRKKHGRERE